MAKKKAATKKPDNGKIKKGHAAPRKGKVGVHVGGRREYETIVRMPANCPRCHATERMRYEKKSIHKTAEGFFEGCLYNRIVWRTCKCACGQAIKEKSFEYHPDQD